MQKTTSVIRVIIFSGYSQDRYGLGDFRLVRVGRHIQTIDQAIIAGLRLVTGHLQLLTGVRTDVQQPIHEVCLEFDR